MSPATRLAPTVLAFGLLLAACGQTGPLRQPEAKPGETAAPEPRVAPTTGDPPAKQNSAPTPTP